LDDIIQTPRRDDQMNDPGNDSANQQKSDRQPEPLQLSHEALRNLRQIFHGYPSRPV
jgi:hypothetical protein